MSSSNLSSSVRKAARASSMRRIMSVASASGAFAQALNRKTSQRSARSSHSAELGSSKLEDEIAHLVDGEVDSGEDDEPQPAPFVAKLAADSPSSGIPRSMSFVARRKRRGSANISHTLSSSAGLAAMPEAEDDDSDEDEDDSEAGDAFDSGAMAGDDNIWAKPSPMVVRKAMPRVPSMIPKRRRKGSVAMEDLDHKRALLHVHAERLHEGEEEDEDGKEEAKLQGRARGRGDNARARKRSVHEVVPQGKGMVRVPSMLPKRKRKGSTTMGSINHTYTALHALNEGEEEAGSYDEEDSHSGEDDLASPYDTPAVSIALPTSGRSIPRTASMVPKRKRKGSVAMDSIETGRTLLHAVLEAPAELTGSEGGSDSSEDDSDSDAPGERRDSLGAKPNYFKRRGRRSSGVHTAPGGDTAGLEDLQRGMVRAPSMIPKRKRRGSSAMESIDVPRAPLGAVAEVGASQRSIDSVGASREVFDFEQGLGASPVVAAGRGVHSSAQRQQQGQQEVVQRGMPRVPSSMPLRKRRGSSAVEDVDFTSMELPTTIHEHDDFDTDDDDESERSDSIAPMRPRAPAQRSRASGITRPSAHSRQGWGEQGAGQAGSGGGRGMPKTRSLYQKRKRKGSSSAVVLQPASAMGALHEVDEDDDDEEEVGQQRRAGAPSTPDTAVLGRNLFAVGHGFVPASSLQSREEAQRFRQAPRATEMVRASKPTAPKRGVRRPHKLQAGQKLGAPKRLGAVSPVSRAMPRVPSMLPKRRRKGSTAMHALEHTPNNLHGPILEETPLHKLGVPEAPPTSRSRGRRSSGVHTSPVAGARVKPRTVPVRSPSFMPKRQRKGSTAMDSMPQFSRTVLTSIDDDINSSSDTLGTLGGSLQSVTVVEDEEVEFVTARSSRNPTPPAMPRMRGSASANRLGVSGSHVDLLTRQGSSPSLPGSGGSSRSSSRGPVRASHTLPPPRTTNARLRTRGARTAAVPQRQPSVKSPLVRTPSNMPRRKRRGSTSLDALDHRRSVLTKIAEKTGMPGMAREGSSGRLRGPAGPLPSPRAPDQGRRGSSDLAPRMVGSSRRIGIGRIDSSNKLTSLGNLKNQGSRSSLPGLQSPRQVASSGLMSSGSGRVRHTEATREAARRSLARKQSARAAAARR